MKTTADAIVTALTEKKGSAIGGSVKSLWRQLVPAVSLRDFNVALSLLLTEGKLTWQSLHEGLGSPRRISINLVKSADGA